MSTKDDLFNSIGSGDKQPNNMKKILIYVAIGFLIFVIGVIGVALLQNNKNSDKNAIIPPETTSQPKQENLFKQIPIEDNSENIQKQQTKQPQEQQEQPQQNIKEEVIKNSNQNPNPKETIQPVLNQKTTPKIKENKTPIKKEPAKIKEKRITIPEVSINKKIKHISHKNKINKIQYYIQVAALLRHKKPSKSFLRLIVKNGYKYKFFVTYTKIKDEKVKVTKILIGPFSNEKEARKALKKVRANITQNAFIFKVK